jgi:hypothetical protein
MGCRASFPATTYDEVWSTYLTKAQQYTNSSSNFHQAEEEAVREAQRMRAARKLALVCPGQVGLAGLVHRSQSTGAVMDTFLQDTVKQLVDVRDAMTLLRYLEALLHATLNLGNFDHQSPAPAWCTAMRKLWAGLDAGADSNTTTTIRHQELFWTVGDMLLNQGPDSADLDVTAAVVDVWSRSRILWQHFCFDGEICIKLMELACYTGPSHIAIWLAAARVFLNTQTHRRRMLMLHRHLMQTWVNGLLRATPPPEHNSKALDTNIVLRFMAVFLEVIPLPEQVADLYHDVCLLWSGKPVAWLQPPDFGSEEDLALAWQKSRATRCVSSRTPKPIVEHGPWIDLVNLWAPDGMVTKQQMVDAWIKK